MTDSSSAPLDAAALHRLESVKILVNAGAKVNDTNGAVLLNACASSDLETVYYLMAEAGADYKKPLMAPEGGKPVYVEDMLDRIKKGSRQYEVKQRILKYISDHSTDDPLPAEYRLDHYGPSSSSDTNTKKDAKK